MDSYIRWAVEKVTGESAESFNWSESLTTAAQLQAMLPGEGRRGITDFLIITDHVNETTKAFDPDIIDLAVNDDRIAHGLELQTVIESPPGSGLYKVAPEVLIYGGVEKTQSDRGTFYGMSATDLQRLQQACRPPDAPRAELHRVLAWCRTHQLAHALAHPLDGHFLELEELLPCLEACQYLEVVNGGFSGDSARRLQRLIDSQIGPSASRWTAWAGSDAHLGKYDRVLVRWKPPVQASPTIGDFIESMICTDPVTAFQEKLFSIEGRGASLLSCLGEVNRLIFHNARNNYDTFKGWRRLSRLVVLGPWYGLRKVIRHRRHQRRLGKAMDLYLSRNEPQGQGCPVL